MAAQGPESFPCRFSNRFVDRALDLWRGLLSSTLLKQTHCGTSLQAAGPAFGGRRQVDPRLAHNAFVPMLARQLLAWTGAQVEGLYPGCFAIVMATGIISNALFVEGPRLLSDAFFLANVVAYPLLAVLTAVRAARFTHAFWSDLSNRGLVFSFFTIVAASSVFGEGLLLRGVSSTALYLWLFALAAWIALII